MFVLSSISSGLEFYKNSEWQLFENIISFDEIFNNWPNDVLGTNVYETVESCWS